MISATMVGYIISNFIRFFILFKLKHVVKERDERRWWLATFFTILFFDVAPLIAFLIGAPILIFLLYGLFSLTMTREAL